MKGGGFGLLGDLLVGLIGAFIGDWLLPQLGVQLGTGIVALICQKQTSAISFDYPIGGSEQRRWDIKTQRFSSRTVDKKQEFRWLLYRKFVRPCAVQDFIDISCRTPRACVGILSITEKGTFLCPWPKAGCKQ